MTFKSRILVACTTLVISLGAAATLPAMADNATAHQASKMMRHQPIMAGTHHRGRTMMHHRRMMHHRGM